MKRRLLNTVSLILVMLTMMFVLAPHGTKADNAIQYSKDASVIVVYVAADEGADRDTLKTERNAAVYAARHILEMSSDERVALRTDKTTVKFTKPEKLVEDLMKSVFQASGELKSSVFSKVGEGIPDLENAILTEGNQDLWFVIVQSQAKDEDLSTKQKLADWLDKNSALKMHFLVLTNEDLSSELGFDTVVGAISDNYPGRAELIQMNPEVWSERKENILPRAEWYTAMQGSHAVISVDKNENGKPSFTLAEKARVTVVAEQKTSFSIVPAGKIVPAATDPNSSEIDKDQLQAVNAELDAGGYWLYGVDEDDPDKLLAWLFPETQDVKFVTQKAVWQRKPQTIDVVLPETYGYDPDSFMLSLTVRMLDVHGDALGEDTVLMGADFEPTEDGHGLIWHFDNITPVAGCDKATLSASVIFTDQTGMTVTEWTADKEMPVDESEIRGSGQITKTLYYDETNQYSSSLSWPVRDLFSYEEADFDRIEFRTKKDPEDSVLKYDKQKNAFVLQVEDDGLPQVLQDKKGKYTEIVIATVKNGDNKEQTPTEPDDKVTSQSVDESKTSASCTIGIECVSLQELLKGKAWEDPDVWSKVQKVTDVPSAKEALPIFIADHEPEVLIEADPEWTRGEQEFQVRFDDSFGLEKEVLSAEATVIRKGANGTSSSKPEPITLTWDDRQNKWFGHVMPGSSDVSLELSAKVYITNEPSLKWETAEPKAVNIVLSEIKVGDAETNAKKLYYDANGKYASRLIWNLDDLFTISEEDKQQVNYSVAFDPTLPGLDWTVDRVEGTLEVTANGLTDVRESYAMTVTAGNQTLTFDLTPVSVQTIFDKVNFTDKTETEQVNEPETEEELEQNQNQKLMVRVGKDVVVAISLPADTADQWECARETVDNLPELQTLRLRLTGSAGPKDSDVLARNQMNEFAVVQRYLVSTAIPNGTEVQITPVLVDSDGWEAGNAYEPLVYIAVNDPPKAKVKQGKTTETIAIEGQERIPFEDWLSTVLGKNTPGDFFEDESGEKLKYTITFDGDAEYEVKQGETVLSSGESVNSTDPVLVTISHEPETKNQQGNEANHGYGLRMVLTAEDEAGQKTEVIGQSDFYSAFERMILTIAIIVASFIVAALVAWILVKQLSKVAFGRQKVKCVAVGDPESIEPLMAQQQPVDLAPFAKQQLTLLQLMILQKQPTPIQVDPNVLLDITIAGGKEDSLRVCCGKLARQVYVGMDRKMTIVRGARHTLDTDTSHIIIQNCYEANATRNEVTENNDW